VSEIRALYAEDFDAFADIAVNAYPGWRLSSQEERERARQRLLKTHKEEPTVTAYGLFRDGRLQGGMFLYDFEMNFLGVRIPAGGVGHIAVDLVHKKENVAKEMITYFLRHYRQRGAPVVLLYAFRPDFYKAMGFGYGTKMNQYRVAPDALPRGPSKAHVRFLENSDKQALLDCYNRFMDTTHGMMAKSEQEITRLMTSPEYRIVGYEKDGRVSGYVVFTFKHGESFLLNDLVVREFVYENSAALSELLTFLHTQADQVRHIFFNTQDEAFHHLLLDPRDGSSELIPSVYHESNLQGVGLVYRVIDVPAMFRMLGGRNFGGQTCRLKLTVRDSFLPENAGSTLLSFERGDMRIQDEYSYDVELGLDIAEFSSLLVGAVNFRSLYSYGLADLSDPGYVKVVDRIFAVLDKPMCTTPF
jgi:predicted acetyltransferase